MTGVDGAALTLQQAADRLGVHYMTAYRYVRTGQLDARRQDGRWLVAATDVEALRRSRSEAPATPGRRAGRTAAGVDRFRTRLLDRLIAGDEAGAWDVVESALVANMRADRAHLDLVAPCLREIGERWEAGTLSVGGEHVASATAARLAARLAPLSVRRGRTRGTVVLAGAPGEQHGLPMTLLANVLRSRGWGVVEMGPDTPTADLVDAARQADRLIAIGLSVGSDTRLRAAADALGDLRGALPDVPLLAGGPGVPDAATAHALGADWWGADADEVDAVLSGLRTSRA